MLIKGQLEYKAWKNGKQLTRRESMLAQCYICFCTDKENRVDCLSEKTCPMYSFYQYKGVEIPPEN